MCSFEEEEEEHKPYYTYFFLLVFPSEYMPDFKARKKEEMCTVALCNKSVNLGSLKCFTYSSIHVFVS
jgi:hypothetical protein